VVADHVVQLAGEVEPLVVPSPLDARAPLAVAQADVDHRGDRCAEQHQHRHRDDRPDGTVVGSPRDRPGGDHQQRGVHPPSAPGAVQHGGEQHGHHDELGEHADAQADVRRLRRLQQGQDGHGGGDRQRTHGPARPRETEGADGDHDQHRRVQRSAFQPRVPRQPQVDDDGRAHDDDERGAQQRAQRVGDTGELHRPGR
jgi:hypothetical protein